MLRNWQLLVSFRHRCRDWRWRWTSDGKAIFQESRVHFADILTTQGKLGLTTDALQSVRLVGADGVVKTVSATSYPDLWWAIRGAGANYGVITSATFKIQPLSNNNGGNAFMLDFVLPAEKSLEYLNIIEKSFNPMPVNLAGIIVFNWNSTHNVVSFSEISKLVLAH